MYSIIVASIFVLFIVHLYSKSINRFCTSKKRLDGETVLITGGSCGIGLEAAIEFAKRGAKVIIASSSKERGAKAAKNIIAKSNNTQVIYKFLDLSSLQSVRNFAEDIINNENQLNVLVNNAGVGVPNDFETADCMNYIMQVNYYGHFLLTLLLLPLLKRTGTETKKSRIICTSSIMHYFASSDVSKYNKTGYHWFKIFIYSNSKLSLVLFVRELSERLKGSNVVVNCIDPGIVATTMCDSVNDVVGAILKILIKLFFKNVWEGAQTTLYVVLEEETGNVNGQFFKNCKLSRARSLSYDKEKIQLLWKDSVKLVKLSDEELQRLLN